MPETASAGEAEEAALLGLAPAPPSATERYGPHPSQVIDLYGPPGGPLVAVLHGGFWREAYDRVHLSPLAAALAGGYGLRVALVEYRRVGGGGGWPGTFEDVGAALEHLRAAGEVRVLAGHSAGGHLALWAASRGPVRCPVVAVAPVADLTRAHELGLSGGAVADLLGGEEHLAARLPGADPMRLPPPDPRAVPVVLLHGAEDADVPVGLSRRYAAARPGVRLAELPGTGHYAPVTPGTAAFGLLARELTRYAGRARGT
ncbi:alpha/beta hydrolase family protein [Streptomyces radiopugnans]|uniref:Prolyl oligopeptidase family protein n=1 Tax=Streptomyces radiopugnans TaxID=403935 RepID=A0A1H9JZM9_9ACTN|nr:alpha/beta hydrolase [Streptomyces radiopugnans]SEQ92227.1 Prolyl oligopeptidase family protein [Streptomyces radiopugnans]